MEMKGPRGSQMMMRRGTRQIDGILTRATMKQERWDPCDGFCRVVWHVSACCSSC